MSTGESIRKRRGNDYKERQQQLAVLQSQLQLSKASIGKRWREAWASTEEISDRSSFGGSELSESIDVSSDEDRSVEEREERIARTGDRDGVSSVSDKQQRELFDLLKREATASGSTLLDEDIYSSLNLTSMHFIDDLEDKSSLSLSSSSLSSSHQNAFNIPRPHKDMKVDLFNDGQLDTTCILPMASSRLNHTANASTHRYTQATETAGDEDIGRHTRGDNDTDEDIDTEIDTEIDREGDAEIDGERDEEIGRNIDEDSDGDIDGEGDIDKGYESYREAAEDVGEKISKDQTNENKETMIDKIHKDKKEIDDKNGEDTLPQTRKEKINDGHAKRIVDMQVDDLLEEHACEQDFYRREMADRLSGELGVFESLNLNVERFKDERENLSDWAKRRKDIYNKEGDRTKYMGNRLRRRPVGDTKGGIDIAYNAKEIDRPLTKDISPRGKAIEDRLIDRSFMPSTKVWQLEQSKDRLRRQTERQRQQLVLLQHTLQQQQQQQQIGGEGGDGGKPDISLSPEQIKLKLYEDECIYLRNLLDEDKEDCDAYKEQLHRLLLRNKVLHKRHQTTLETLKIQQERQEEHKRQQMEVEDEMKEMKVKVEEETARRIKEMRWREQREEQSKAMQERYIKLINYLEEVEEKSSSYEEGLRIAESKAEEAEAKLQIKEKEIATARHYIQSQNNKILEKDVMMRKERDRAIILQQKIEELTKLIKSKDEEIGVLKERVEDSIMALDREKEEHEKTREEMKGVKATVSKMEKEINALQMQLGDSRSIVRKTRERLAMLESLAKEIESLANAREGEGEEWYNALESKRYNILMILQETENMLLSLPTQADVHTLREVSKQLAVGEEQRVSSAFEVELKNAREKIEMMDNELKEREIKMTEMMKERNGVEIELKRERSRIKCMYYRLVRNAFAWGWNIPYHISNELKSMKNGIVIEMIINHNKRNRPELRYIKMFKGGIVMWTEDISGQRGYKRGEQFCVSDIVGIDYGMASSAYQLSIDEYKSDKNKKSRRLALPWRCFTVRTRINKFDYRTRNDEDAINWVVGLGRLSGIHSSPMIKNRHEAIIRGVYMKLEAYARKRGVSVSVIWKEAIYRTIGRRDKEGEKGGRRDSNSPSSSSLLGRIEDRSAEDKTESSANDKRKKASRKDKRNYRKDTSKGILRKAGSILRMATVKRG